MADITFGNTTEMLKNAVSGAGLDHTIIANNIANVNTPNFRRTDLSFKEALAATEVTPPDPDQLSLTTTSDKHIPINDEIPPRPFELHPVIQDDPQMRVDHSNVDVDQEMAKLSQNSSYAQTMTQLLQVEYSRIRSAIEERA